MVSLSSLVAFAAIAAPAMAALLGTRDDTPASCAGLPDGSSGTLPYNLTLAAYRTDQSKPANIPLYLAPVPSTSPAGGDLVFAVRRAEYALMLSYACYQSVADATVLDVASGCLPDE